jgi:4-hydroxy-4-methyl-2-oxoglutarate aldolase
MVHSTDYTLAVAPSLHACASLGEGNAKTMMNRGCVGVVTDRLIRDAKNIIKMGLPVFCRGIKSNPSPSRTGIAAINVPVSCGDVVVNPGDIVFGDYDGVVVIPREVEDKAINLALEMLEHEEFVDKGLSEGKSLHDVLQEWNKLHPDRAISWH